jgi:hypothetical protein
MLARTQSKTKLNARSTFFKIADTHALLSLDAF